MCNCSSNFDGFDGFDGDQFLSFVSAKVRETSIKGVPAESLDKGFEMLSDRTDLTLEEQKQILMQALEQTLAEQDADNFDGEPKDFDSYDFGEKIAIVCKDNKVTLRALPKSTEESAKLSFNGTGKKVKKQTLQELVWILDKQPDLSEDQKNRIITNALANTVYVSKEDSFDGTDEFCEYTFGMNFMGALDDVYNEDDDEILEFEDVFNSRTSVSFDEEYSEDFDNALGQRKQARQERKAVKRQLKSDRKELKAQGVARKDIKAQKKSDKAMVKSLRLDQKNERKATNQEKRLTNKEMRLEKRYGKAKSERRKDKLARKININQESLSKAGARKEESKARAESKVDALKNKKLSPADQTEAGIQEGLLNEQPAPTPTASQMNDAVYDSRTDIVDGGTPVSMGGGGGGSYQDPTLASQPMSSGGGGGGSSMSSGGGGGGGSYQDEDMGMDEQSYEESSDEEPMYEDEEMSEEGYDEEGEDDLDEAYGSDEFDGFEEMSVVPVEEREGSQGTRSLRHKTSDRPDRPKRIPKKRRHHKSFDGFGFDEFDGGFDYDDDGLI